MKHMLRQYDDEAESTAEQFKQLEEKLKAKYPQPKKPDDKGKGLLQSSHAAICRDGPKRRARRWSLVEALLGTILASKSETIMARRIDKGLICLEGVGKLKRRDGRSAERKVQ